MTDWILSAARLLQFAPALALFGSALFSLYGPPVQEEPACADDSKRARDRLAWLLMAAIGLISTLAWLSAEARYVAGAWTAAGTLLTETRFGPIAASRAGLFVLAGLTCLTLRHAKALAIAMSILGCAIVASFAWTGHGLMNTGSARLLHLGADALHLLAAGTWVGALWSLSILTIRTYRKATQANARQLARGLTQFSIIGPAVVGLLMLTGLINAWYLIGITRWTALFRTSYGLNLVAKLLLFAGMLALAAINRWWLTPRLQQSLATPMGTDGSVRALGSSVLTEAALMLLVLAIVAVLGTLAPPVSAS